jgi:pimeloyl-ACP methyl ester carboxylesterase
MATHHSEKTITIGEDNFPVKIYGTGKIPCLCIGTAELVARTLSENILQLFTVYAVDLYFIKNKTYNDIPSLDLPTIAKHYLAAAKQLQLQHYILLGFSCFGILAAEMAKQHQHDIAGLLLISTPPEWNDTSILNTQDYFNTHAEPERIANDQKRKAYYEKIKTPTDSETSVARYIADSARYWANYNISDQEIRTLWDGVECNDAIINQFFLQALPRYNLAEKIETITIPVLVLAGECDFDSIPLVQWERYPKPPQFQMLSCGKVGHWPNIENTPQFDLAITQWVKKLLR